MKEKQNKRWGLKLLSVLCAFLVWLGVVNVADPVMTSTVEVPVEIVNGEVLEASGLTYEIIGKKTTTVSYEVKTTNAHRIRPADFRAYADMTDLWSVTGSIPVKVEVLNHSEYLLSAPVSRVSTIKIETEPLQKKRFDINVSYAGDLEEGYEAGDVVLSPDHLYVEGPESTIGQISSVGIEISLDGLTMDAEGTASPQFYDANGNKIVLDQRVEVDCESVSYSMPVLKVKSLLLDFEVSGQVADGYRFTGVECDVKSVPVIGLKSVLASLNTITIPGESLNLDGARTNMVRTIDINEYLPVGVSLAGTGRHEINVTLTVEQLKERVYTVEVNDASFTGENDDYIYRAEPDTVNIRIEALAEELDSLTLDSADIQVDVSSMGEGIHEAKVVLKLDLDRVYRVLDISSCSIQVMKVPEATESAPSSGMAEETAAEPSTGAGETTDASGAQDGTEVSGTAASHETEESRRAEVHPAEESSSAQENR